MADGCQCFEKGWTKHDGPCLYQQPARLGVQITRHATMTTAGAVYYPTVPNDPPRAWRTDGLWFATTPEAVAELRERVIGLIVVRGAVHGIAPLPVEFIHETADAVLRALGFTDA